MSLKRLGRKVLASLALSGALGAPLGCSPYSARSPGAPPVEIPYAFSESGTTDTLSNRWWNDFESEELDQLIDDAIAGNLELEAAWARLDQAVARARQSTADLWPQISGEARASKSQSTFFAGPGLQSSFTSEQVFFALAASYEVDLWRRIWSLKTASDLDLTATRENVATAAMTLAGETADAWISLVEQRAQYDLLERQVEVGEGLRRLVELRFSQGLNGALDVYQQRQQVASTRAQIPRVEAQIRERQNQIALLRGKPPPGPPLGLDSKLPALPPLPSTGVPADLLTRRPDVRAAAVRVAAADHRVAAAVADRLPALRLTGQRGTQSFSPSVEDLFDSSIWTIVGNLSAPLFDGGRRRAKVDEEKARVAELLSDFGQVFLESVREVEDALAREEGQRKELIELDREITLARRALERAQARYVGGLSDYLPVLAAVESLQQVERDLLAGRRQLLSFRIQLYRALGGSWTSALERDDELADELTLERRRESRAFDES